MVYFGLWFLSGSGAIFSTAPYSCYLMKLDRFGLLQPPDKIALDLDTFRTTFVDNMQSSSKREAIYQAYTAYTEQFKLEVTGQFSHWIGGSFTTDKLNPSDIDVLTILPEDVYEQNEVVINNNFRRRMGIESYVDGYFLSVVPPAGKRYALYHSDYLYWLHQFTYTRKGKNNRRRRRGFIEITYNNYTYEQ